MVNPKGDYSACIAGQVEMFRDLYELRVLLSMTYPDTAFELVEVTDETWQGFYDQGVFFDDWS
ncbi:hypothetical protein [Aeromonas veronii]|uniref:hypothetical protein n=1 Tax=Aeromonas veronii TaxID=654 RepID=UPI00191E582C|nr:hypothetical protein [Aeromonas veronii]MBL0594143.1 hypothetical protein [Aeromonas veronii]